jgi:hypothetical protein
MLAWREGISDDWRRLLRRCHRRTVSGLTMTRVSFQCAQDRGNRNQKYRSDLRSLGRRWRRFKTAICWRSARFSRAKSERSCRVVGIRESSRRIVSIMGWKCRTPRPGKSTPSNGDGVLASYRRRSRTDRRPRVQLDSRSMPAAAELLPARGNGLQRTDHREKGRLGCVVQVQRKRGPEPDVVGLTDP